MKKFIAEFKEFISRGSVMDLAVGMIIGSAFTAIVTSLVNDIFMPLIGLLTAGYVDFSNLSFTINKVTVTYGNFIQAVVNFLLIAFCIFCVIRALNRLREMTKKKEEAKAEEAAPAEPSEEILLLREIRDSLKK